MNKWIAKFELEDGDTMPEHMDLEYKGAKIDFHCRPMWIPCSERLPEYGKEVLLYVRDNLHEREWQGVGRLGRDIRYRKLKAWDFVTLPRRYSAEQITGRMQYDVIAWMPLPEPYKEVDDE